MVASYFMLSPSGMIMSNIDGANRTFFPLEDISHDRISRVLDVKLYIGRNAVYPW
jgi:hypothetical protein